MKNMTTWKNLSSWRGEQLKGNRGAKHKHRFSSSLDIERALIKTGGEQWLHTALHRERWRDLTTKFVEQHDTPRTMQRQLQIDNLTPTTRTHPTRGRARGCFANDRTHCLRHTRPRPSLWWRKTYSNSAMRVNP